MSIVNWEAVSSNQDDTAQTMAVSLLLTHSSMADKLFRKYVSFLRVEHFTHETLAQVYDIIGQLIEKNEAPTSFKVCREMGLKKGDETAKQIMSLSGANGLPSDYKSYVFAIVEDYKKKQIVEALAKELDWIDSKNSEEVIGNLKEVVSQIEEEKPSDRTTRSNDLGSEIVKELGDKKEIYPSGIRGLDKAMYGGFVAGKMYAICARKKTGKTVLATTLSYNLAKSGVKSFFMACEMGKKEIHQRSLARDIGRNCGIFLYEDVIKYKDELSTAVSNDMGNIHYHDGQGITFKQLKIEYERAVNVLGAKVFFLDYIQLIGGRSPKMSEAQFMDEVSQWLAEFCLHHNVVGIIVAQMNQMGNVRGGEGIRLACSQAYELRRSETYVNGDSGQTEGYYLEMLDTRYAPWQNIGTEEEPALFMANAGPHFAEL